MNMRKVPETPLTCEVRAALEEYTQRLMNIYPERFIESDPEAWRDEYRKKQVAGVRFEKLWYDGFWRKGKCDFTGIKKNYREVQEAPKVKENDVIPEASREILKAWQANGLKFKSIGMNANFALQFTDKTDSNYSIPEQPIPEGMSWATIKDMFKQGLRLDVNDNFNGVWCNVTEGIKLSSFSKNNLRIPAQSIPEKLLEVPQEVKEVKPKTVKYYFALFKNAAGKISVEFADESNVDTLKGLSANWSGHTIIGNIEEREVEL